MADGLDKEQSWAWIFEQDAVKQLLAHGVHTYRETRMGVYVVDAVTAVWAIGLEKLLKLALGMSKVRDEGSWPSDLKKLGHDLESLDCIVRSDLAQWMLEGRSEYLKLLVQRVENDPVRPLLIRALSEYGQAGRYHHLDVLAKKATKSLRPDACWQDVEAAAAQCLQLSGDLEADAAAIRSRVCDSVTWYWHMMTRLARHGWLGEVGCRFGANAEPANAVPVVAVDDVL